MDPRNRPRSRAPRRRALGRRGLPAEGRSRREWGAAASGMPAGRMPPACGWPHAAPRRLPRGRHRSLPKGCPETYAAGPPGAAGAPSGRISPDPLRHRVLRPAPRRAVRRRPRLDGAEGRSRLRVCLLPGRSSAAAFCRDCTVRGPRAGVAASAAEAGPAVTAARNRLGLYKRSIYL